MMYRQINSEIDQSVNFLAPAPDGGMFEARYVRRAPEYFVCYLSSHSGCRKACRMCHLTATGQTSMMPAALMDYERQASAVFRYYRDEIMPHSPAEFVNFNFMARGEPLSNPLFARGYERLFAMLRNVADRFGLRAQFNVSTIYPDDAPHRPLFGDARTTIYYSMYSTIPITRKRWLPRAARVGDALSAIKIWQACTHGNVIIHGPLIKGVNDDGHTVSEMIRMVRVHGVRVRRFNLVRYNPPYPGHSEEADEDTIRARVEQFRLSFGDAKIVPRVGFDVKASCGMFVERDA